MEEEFYYSCFEKGYPKKVFFKHITPLKIYYGPNDEIIGFYPRKLEYWKYIYNSQEEDNLYNKK